MRVSSAAKVSKAAFSAGSTPAQVAASVALRASSHCWACSTFSAASWASTASWSSGPSLSANGSVTRLTILSKVPLRSARARSTALLCRHAFSWIGVAGVPVDPDACRVGRVDVAGHLDALQETVGLAEPRRVPPLALAADLVRVDPHRAVALVVDAVRLPARQPHLPGDRQPVAGLDDRRSAAVGVLVGPVCRARRTPRCPAASPVAASAAGRGRPWGEYAGSRRC